MHVSDIKPHDLIGGAKFKRAIEVETERVIRKLDELGEAVFFDQKKVKTLLAEIFKRIEHIHIGARILYHNMDKTL
jgi:hypothetical protein